MPNLYKTSLSSLPFFVPTSTIPAGYTQRMLPVGVSSYSGQRQAQTYIATVQVVLIQGVALHVLSDANPRTDLNKALPFQLFHLYTTSMSSPDGDIPFKHGDYFVPTSPLVGLVTNTQHPIRGIQAYPQVVELLIERKL